MGAGDQKGGGGADGGASDSDYGSSLGGGPTGARRALASMMEEVEFHKESALNLSAQVGDASEGERGALPRAAAGRGRGVKYKRDAEELFMSHQEKDREARRHTRTIEELSVRVQELEDAKAKVEDDLAKAEARGDAAGPAPQHWMGASPHSTVRAL